ncbi:MAG TPA: PAS domain-containing protein [Rubricoccaceae bacterium]
MNLPSALSVAGAVLALAFGHVIGWIIAGALLAGAVAFGLSKRRALIVAKREADVAEADLRAFWALGLPVVKVDTRPPLRDARYLEVSPPFARLVGRTADELLARPYVDFVHPCARAETIAMADRIDLVGSDASAGFVNAYEAGPLHARPGSRVWLQWTPAPPAAGSTIYLVTDVTAVREEALAAERRALDAEQARTASARTQAALSSLPTPGTLPPTT